MSVTFPLAKAAFADLLQISQVSWQPGHKQELSGLGSGFTITSDVSPAIRRAEVRSRAMENDEAADRIALFEALGGSVHSFELYDPRKLYPRADPDGSVLGASTVTINSLGGYAALALTGLPAGYVISRGDLMSWNFGSSPSYRAFHRAIETATANGAGTTPEFMVRDFMMPGTITGIEVTLVKPAGLFKVEPGTLRDESVNTFKTRIAFSAYQVFEIEE